MSISIQAKTDYTYLFSSLGTNASNAASSNFLIQYASIKNGSYAKLMKAYYSETSSDTVKSLVNNQSATSTEEKTNLTKVQTTTDALKESADAMLENGSKSVFAQKDITTKDENGVETTTKGYDVDGIYKAVNDFVTNYNSVINAVNNTEDTSTINRAQSMINNTTVNLNLLNDVGISQKDDGTLSIDKDIFSKADMDTVKSLFNGNGSYGYRTSAQASLINYAAEHAASRRTTYTVSGTYNNTYNMGNLFSMYL